MGKHRCRKLGLHEKFMGVPETNTGRTVGDFWQWAYSDLMQNIERGVLAEFIVAFLLGIDKELRVPWLPYDLKLSNGRTIEVKTMARLQAWYQKELSNPKVVIKPTRAWDHETGSMEDTPRFQADIYVICFFVADSHEMANPLDLGQWKFYTFSRAQIIELLKRRKSISLDFLNTQNIKPVTAHELRNNILKSDGARAL